MALEQTGGIKPSRPGAREGITGQGTVLEAFAFTEMIGKVQESSRDPGTSGLRVGSGARKQCQCQ